MKAQRSALALLALSLLGSCASAPSPQARFRDAVRAMTQHDRERDWQVDTCRRLADDFEALASSELAGAAHLHAGLVLQRCGDHEQARARMLAAVTAEPSLQLARAELSLYQYEQSPTPARLDQAIDALHRAAVQRPDPDVLTDLARLLLERSRPGAQPASSDAAAARGMLIRALALEPDHVGALHQLASYYILQSRSPGDSQGRTLNLEQATAICKRVAERFPSYAPVYNALGRIASESGDLDAASSWFDRARTLDPAFFDAHMNLGSVNLMLRAPDRAEEPYRRAIVLRPGSYDAWLGLGVALRLKAAPEHLEQEMASIEHCLDRCVAIDPARPESWFNRAILYHDRAIEQGDMRFSLPQLQRSSELLSEFLARAGDAPSHAAKVRDARTRQQEIGELVAFIKGSLKAR